MSRISERVSRVEPQQIRVMFELSKQVEHDDIVHLEFGEADFDTPEHAVAAANRAASAGETKYTSNAGIDTLRQAIADRIERASQQTVDPAREVVVTTGGVEALYLAMLTVADSGEEVVIPTPVWPNIISQATLGGCHPIEVPLDANEGYYSDVGDVIESIDDHTAAVALVSPSNPTGQIYEPAAIRAIAEAAVDNEAFLIADEVYRELMYVEPPPPIVDLAEDPDWVLSVDSTSKSHSMTGWRVGWLTGAEDVIDEVVKIRENTTSCVNTPAQYAAIAALTEDQSQIGRMREELDRRRGFVLSELETCAGLSPLRPLGGFYVFVELEEVAESSMAFAKRLLREEGVVVAPGSAFGAAGEGHIRISFGNDLERLRDGMNRLKRFMD